jgi:hypothetical protein
MAALQLRLLNDPKLVDCHQMKGAAVSMTITALYGNIKSYAAED